MAQTPDQACFHCGQPVPPGSDYPVEIDGAARPMCCRGCQAVAQAIVDGGLEDYYRHRTESAPTGRELVPEMLKELQGIAGRHNVKIVSFGHAGDGNIHVNIMTDRENPEEFGRATEAVKDVFETTLKLDGTISGEHGIGLTKAPYLEMELSKESIRLMGAIKTVFDPKGILNPGKIFQSD